MILEQNITLVNRHSLGKHDVGWLVYYPLSLTLIAVTKDLHDELMSYGKAHAYPDFEEYINQKDDESIFQIKNSSKSKLINGKYYGTDLVLIPTLNCQLRCGYCFAAGGESKEKLTLKQSEIAIKSVLRNAALFSTDAKRGLSKFTFLGGGEPTFEWRLFTEMVELISKYAKQYAVDTKLTLVTNALLSESKAKWIAARFDKIGVSMDGLPQIQNLQRSRVGGSPSSDIVARTIRIFTNADISVSIRGTVTQAGIKLGKETIEYLFTHFPKLRTVQLEPAFPSNVGRSNFDAPKAEDFVKFIQAAIEAADQFGKKYCVGTMALNNLPKTSSCSSSLGGVVHLTPGGNLSSCNEVVNDKNPLWNKFRLGNINEQNGIMNINSDYVEESITKSGIPYGAREECSTCVARWTCSGGCRARHMSASKEDQPYWCDVVIPLTKWMLKGVVNPKNKVTPEFDFPGAIYNIPLLPIT